MTRYSLSRDISGAISDVLPFSDCIIEDDGQGLSIHIPSEANMYVALFSVIPVIGDVSITRVEYNENPELGLPSIYFITPELSFAKAVKGGSVLSLSRFRGDVDPDTIYKVYLYQAR